MLRFLFELERRSENLQIQNVEVCPPRPRGQEIVLPSRVVRNGHCAVKEIKAAGERRESERWLSCLFTLHRYSIWSV